MYRTHQQQLDYEAIQKIKAYQTLYNITMTQIENLVREEFIKIWTNPDTYLPEGHRTK